MLRPVMHQIHYTLRPTKKLRGSVTFVNPVQFYGFRFAGYYQETGRAGRDGQVCGYSTSHGGNEIDKI
jgi:hypothetical protein